MRNFVLCFGHEIFPKQSYCKKCSWLSFSAVCMQFNLKGDFLWKFPDLNRHTNILYHQFEQFQNSRMSLNSTINFDEFNNIVEFDNSFSSCFLFFTLLSQKPIFQLSLHVCKLSVLEVCN